MNYQQMVERETKIRQLKSSSNWKWELKDEKALIFIDTLGLPDALSLVRPYFHKDTSLREENCHLDKHKTLIVALIEPIDGFTVDNLIRWLTKSSPIPQTLYATYVFNKVVLNAFSWKLHRDGVSLECAFSCDYVCRQTMLQILRKNKSKILDKLIHVIRAPAGGHLYLEGNVGSYRLYWHSCPVCNEPYRWYEFLMNDRHFDLILIV